MCVCACVVFCRSVHLLVFLLRRSHAGLFERRNCSVYKTSERQSSRRIKYREESQGYPLGREIVSVNHKGILYSMSVSVVSIHRITGTILCVTPHMDARLMCCDWDSRSRGQALFFGRKCGEESVRQTGWQPLFNVYICLFFSHISCQRQCCLHISVVWSCNITLCVEVWDVCLIFWVISTEGSVLLSDC